MANGSAIAQVTVTDLKAFILYQEADGDLLMANGARVIVNEGSLRVRTIIFEFDSFEKAKTFRDGPEYQKVTALRISTANGYFTLIEGVN